MSSSHIFYLQTGFPDLSHCSDIFLETIAVNFLESQLDLSSFQVLPGLNFLPVTTSQYLQDSGQSERKKRKKQN